jgi:hypothetical protein
MSLKCGQGWVRHAGKDTDGTGCTVCRDFVRGSTSARQPENERAARDEGAGGFARVEWMNE